MGVIICFFFSLLFELFEHFIVNFFIDNVIIEGIQGSSSPNPLVFVYKTLGVCLFLLQSSG